MPPPTLRVAIAGTGFVGGLHARAARLAGGHIVGVSASTPERAQAAAQQLGADRGYASSEELVTADAVDVVHVCTPNHLHAPLAEAALAAGKHVVCEKPLAVSGDEAQRLADAAAAAPGLLAAVPFVYRYNPVVFEARERVRSGQTGPVRLLHGTYLQDWLLREEDDNWRVDADFGGPSRAFADIGSHWCDLAEFVSGHRIARLSARTLTALPQRRRSTSRAAFVAADGQGELRDIETEDAVVMQFETDRGALGSTIISQISPGRKNRLWLEVDGAEESLVFDQEEPERLRSGRREGTALVWRDPQHLSPPAARLATLPAGHPQGYGDCFDLFVADAYAVARGGEPADGMPAFADGLRAARLTDAAIASARDGGAWREV